jgi:LCP family protein required for cell wall assembly
MSYRSDRGDRPGRQDGDQPAASRRQPTDSRRQPSDSRRQPSDSGRDWRTTGSRKRGLAKAAYVATAVLGVVVVVAALVGYNEYRHLFGNIKSVAVAGLSHRSIYGAQNILVLGSQTRQGQGKGFGQNPSLYTSNSDNLLLVHLDPTHTHATVLSIPRDTMVYEPGCKSRKAIDGGAVMGPYQQAIIDGAMNIGGPSCAVKTVEDLTGIKLDHFIEFKFDSFRQLVNTIGGIRVCVPFKGGYHDPYSGLNLSEGWHTIHGNVALMFVRTRHGVGTGGDLGRIELQQEFISALVQKIEKAGTLSSIPKLLKIADVATRALTVDSGLDTVGKLLGLAKSLKGLHTKSVNMITMPTLLDPTNPDRLLTEEPQDDVLFQMLIDGQRWHHHLPVLPADKVQVKVLNGTSIPNLAAHAAAKLRKLGFDVVGTGTAAPTSTTTVTYAGTVQADSAWTLMTQLKGSPAGQDTLAEPAPQVGVAGPVTLVLGTDFAGVRAAPPPGKHPSHHHGGNGGAAGQVQSRNAGSNLCSGMPAPNSDPGAP